MTKYGVWTQAGQILCPECASQLGKGVKQKQTYASGEAKCEHCQRKILVDGSLAKEQELVYKARQNSYVDSWMQQAGGMSHVASISFTDYSGRQWSYLCTYQINPMDYGDTYWYTEVYGETGELLSERDASSIEEILENIYWMQRNCCIIPSTSCDKALGDSDM